MNLYSFVLFLTLLSFSQAYKNYRTETNKDYCILGNTPVCGTNGYENFRLDNECEFNNFNSKQLEGGQIVLSKIPLENCYPSSSQPSIYGSSSYSTYCPQYCNKIFKPVCASYRNVQRNFTNECELKKYICDTKTNWQIILNGTCVAASCALDGQEVCAAYKNYTQTFPNLLSLYGDIQATGKNWHILNVGPCPCPSDYWPICAQLNCTAKTFQNHCFLEQEIKNGSYWSILFFGECPELPTANTTINGTDIGAVNGTDTGAVNGTDTGAVNATDTTTTVLNTTTTANCNLSNFLYTANQAINNKPVYIVRKNKISPYVSQGYRTYEKSASQIYQPSYNLPVYSQASYKPPSTVAVTGGSYNPANVQSSSSYGVSISLPYEHGVHKSSNYASSYPAYSSSSLSTYNSDYKHKYQSKPSSNSNYDTDYSSDYNPVSVKSSNSDYSSNYNPVNVKSSNCNIPNISYGGDNYDDSSFFIT